MRIYERLSLRVYEKEKTQTHIETTPGGRYYRLLTQSCRPSLVGFSVTRKE